MSKLFCQYLINTNRYFIGNEHWGLAMHYAFFIWNSVYHKISIQNPIDENASFVDVLTCVTVTKGQVLKSVSVP